MDTTNTVLVIAEALGAYILITTIFYIYKLFATTNVIRKFYKRKLIRNAVLIVVLLFLFVVVNGMRTTLTTTSSSGFSGAYVDSVGRSGLFSRWSDDVSYNTTCPPGYIFNGVTEACESRDGAETNKTITDTREFLKKTFSATLKTRKVETVAKKTELLIKGSGGRVDNSSVASEYAYFSFVIPKDSLDSFEEQLRTYTNAKLYMQSISTQNMLSDKQNLESKQSTNKTTTAQLTQQKQKAQSEYSATAKSLQAQISSAKAKLDALNAAIANTSDQQTRANLQQQQAATQTQIQTLQRSLDQATTTFKSTMSSLGVSLDDQSKILLNLNNQEDAFFDNIDTVEGTVRIERISVWQLLVVFSPINPVFLIAILLAVWRFLTLRKRERDLAVTETPIEHRASKGQFPEKYV